MKTLTITLMAIALTVFMLPGCGTTHLSDPILVSDDAVAMVGKIPDFQTAMDLANNVSEILEKACQEHSLALGGTGFHVLEPQPKDVPWQFLLIRGECVEKP